MIGEFKLKCLWHDFECDRKTLCNLCPHMPKEEDKPNYHNARKRAELDFMDMPICPSCYEPTYDEKRCFFCGQRIKIRKYSPKPLIAKYKGYKGVYVSGSMWIYHNGNFVLHGQCKKLTPNELRKQLKTMPRLLTVLTERK